MKKVSCFLAVALCVALFVSLVSAPLSMAQDKGRSGEELYKSCSSCHSPAKGNIAGLKKDYLLTKFAFYQEGTKFMAMKKLFDAMTAEEKATLAQYIEQMK